MTKPRYIDPNSGAAPQPGGQYTPGRAPVLKEQDSASTDVGAEVDEALETARATETPAQVAVANLQALQEEQKEGLEHDEPGEVEDHPDDAEEPTGIANPTSDEAVAEAREQAAEESDAPASDLPEPEQAPEAPTPGPDSESEPESRPEATDDDFSNYDPSEKTVAEVLDDTTGEDVESLKQVLEAEKSGKNRSTLVNALEERISSRS